MVTNSMMNFLQITKQMTLASKTTIKIM